MPDGGGPGWTSLVLFVSSTFRDLDRERDLLTRIVFPELAERLRERRCELVPVDLRWGVDTKRFADQADKEAEVLTVCLRELERARPHVVVLLGDRYGWVPPAERMVGVGDRAGEWSVTHLEVARGVLEDPDGRDRAVALVRDSLPYDEMSREQAAELSDEHATDADASARADRLASLKDELSTTLGPRLRTYRAGWDGARVTDLEGDFVAEATELIWSMLDEATAERVSAPTSSWQDDERAAIDAHLHRRAQVLEGRDQEVGELVEHCLSGGGGVLLVAESGAGKSAVLAGVLARLEDEALGSGTSPASRVPLVLVHAAGTTPRSTSVLDLVERWNDELAARLGAGEVLAPGADAQRARLAELLTRAGVADGGVVLLLDAVDQLEATPSARRLSWLPDPLPAGVRMVATTIPGADASAVSAQRGWQEQQLQPLWPRSAAALVESTAARRGRTVPSAVQEAIVDRASRQGVLPLWLDLVVNELLELGEEEYRTLRLDDGSAEERLERLLVRTVEALPEDLPGVYGALYERAGSVHGGDFVDAVVSLLGTSRSGLREGDLATLVPQVGDVSWAPVRFARLRRQLVAHLVEQEDGRWDLAHHQGRLEAERRAGDRGPQLHHAIATHLAALGDDDPVAMSELAHHRIGAGDGVGALGLLADPPSPPWRDATVAAVASELVRQHDQVGAGAAARWAASALGSSSLSPDDRRAAAFGLLFEVDPRLDGALPASERLELLRTTIVVVQEPGAVPPEPESGALLVHLWLRIGELQTADGALLAARQTLEAALAVAEEVRTRVVVEVEGFRCAICDEEVLSQEVSAAEGADVIAAHLEGHGDHEAAAWVRASARSGLHTDADRDLAYVHDRLGDLCQVLGDLDGAVQHHEGSLATRRRLFSIFDRPPALVGAELLGEVATDGERLEAGRALSQSLRSVATALVAQHRLDEAAELAEEAVALAERLLADVADDEANQDEVVSACSVAADVTQSRGEPHLARRHLDRAATVVRARHRAAPASLIVARQRLQVLGRSIEVRRADQDLEAATAAVDEARSVWQSRAASAPVDLTAALAATQVLAAASEVLLANGDPAAAGECADEAHELGAEALAAVDVEVVGLAPLAASLCRVGDVDAHVGRLDRAEQAYLGAAEAVERLVAETGGAPHVIADLAVPQRRLGGLRAAAGRGGEARTSFERALALSDQVLATHPHDPTAGQARAEVLVQLGELAAEEGDSDGAARCFDAARDTLRALLVERPGRRDTEVALAAAEDRAGDLAVTYGEIDRAAGHFEVARDLRRRLHERSPHDVLARHDLAKSESRLAAAAVARGDAVEALGHVDAGRRLVLVALQELPEHGVLRAAAAALEHQDATIRRSTGDEAGAAERARAGIEHADVALEGGSQDPDLHELAQACVELIAELDEQAGATESVLAQRRRALELARAACHLPAPPTRWTLTRRLLAASALGDAEAASRRWDEAAAALEEAWSLAGELEVPGDDGVAARWSTVSAAHRLGQVARLRGDAAAARRWQEEAAEGLRALREWPDQSLPAARDLLVVLEELASTTPTSEQLPSASEASSLVAELRAAGWADEEVVVRVQAALAAGDPPWS